MQDTAKYWEGTGAWKGVRHCKCLGMGGYLDRDLGWDMSLGGCKSLEVQASEREYRPGRRQEHGRGLNTGARERTGVWEGAGIGGKHSFLRK